MAKKKTKQKIPCKTCKTPNDCKAKKQCAKLARGRKGIYGY